MVVSLALLDMLYDAGNDIGVGDCANHSKFAAALRASLDVEAEHSVEAQAIQVIGAVGASLVLLLCSVLAGEGWRGTMR